MLRTNKLLLGFLLFLDVGIGRAAASPDRAIMIQNSSGSRVEVNWMNPDNGDRVCMSDPDILTGSDFKLDSYVSHEFEVKELPNKKTGICFNADTTDADGYPRCRAVFFTVNEHEEQFINVDKNFQIQHSDHKTKAKDEATQILEDCKTKAIDALATDTDMSSDQVLARMEECMEERTVTQLKNAADDVYFEEQVRKTMGALYENYTCMDFQLPSSEPIDERTWDDPKTGRSLDSLVMLDRPSSKIHVIENFITEEECQAMEETAKPRLQKAVVADGSGGHQESENRKAMQAGISVPWKKESEHHPITTISRRVYDYVNDAMGLSIDEHGQERLMSIQYFAAENKTGDIKYQDYDQYLPHCDGDCTGDPHKYAGRVATMVMYCTVPKLGGATNFRNSGIHVQAKAGSAVFFSYYNVETGIMDTGFTEHSGCPVVEGEKKIVTQWVRHGVTKELPWTAYNSCKLKVVCFVFVWQKACCCLHTSSNPLTVGVLMTKANEQDYGIVTPDASSIENDEL